MERKEKEYISIFDYPTTKVLIVEFIEPENSEFEDPTEDFIDSIGVDPSNAHFMVSQEFPLDLSKSSSSVLEGVFTRVKAEVISRISELFIKNPGTIVSFGERRIVGEEDEDGVLVFEDSSYRWGDGFTDVEIRLSDFCTDDLFYILEKLEEVCK